ncbi:hypothetical protein AX769_17290 [Frondihabitans sp. PAMC 28766]|nr:hypothetical protein AX769_17290 [Frondihabitans sp. PAMC 28766]
MRNAFSTVASASTRSDGREGGDIRTAVLVELGEEPMHGYQIIRAIETRSGGLWTPSPGTVYPTLQLLVDEALVVAEQVGERKVYTLTDAGRRAATEVSDAEPPREQPRRQGVQSAVILAKSGVALAQALTQIAQSGAPQQSERAVAIVDEARRKLYAILAEG